MRIHKGLLKITEHGSSEIIVLREVYKKKCLKVQKMEEITYGANLKCTKTVC